MIALESAKKDDWAPEVFKSFELAYATVESITTAKFALFIIEVADVVTSVVEELLPNWASLRLRTFRIAEIDGKR